MQVADPSKAKVLLCITQDLTQLPVVRILRDPSLVQTERLFIDVDLAGYRHSLAAMADDDVFTLGRADDADVSVQDYEDTSISRVHVIVFKKDGLFVVANTGGSGAAILDSDGSILPPTATKDFASWASFLDA